MPRKKYTEEQIAFALRQAEQGTAVAEICRSPTRSVGRDCRAYLLSMEEEIFGDGRAGDPATEAA